VTTESQGDPRKRAALRSPPSIRYQVGGELDLDAVIEVYNASRLDERRPVQDRATLADMLAHANLIVTAWDDATLVGIARTFTDFSHVGYLADIAVRASHQALGIGVEMIRTTQRQMGRRSSLVLLVSPESVAYFLKMGFTTVNGTRILRAGNPGE
jgi:ribosomal protein S18 acetylase RimI-like enzyme